MSTPADKIIVQLKSMGSPEDLAGMARFGISTERALGVKMGDVQTIIKANRNNHALALELWDSGYREARLIAAHIADPKKVMTS